MLRIRHAELLLGVLFLVLRCPYYSCIFTFYSAIEAKKKLRSKNADAIDNTLEWGLNRWAQILFEEETNK